MWIPCLPGARPATWTLTWTVPAASSTSRTQPTEFPAASTNAPSAWIEPDAEVTLVRPSRARTELPMTSARRDDIADPSVTRTMIHRMSIYRVAIYATRRPACQVPAEAPPPAATIRRDGDTFLGPRSEERRVGKECRSRWSEDR